MTIKEFLIEKFFKIEWEDIRRLRLFLSEQKKRQESLTIVDLVRTQLKGFNPLLLDSYDDIELTYPEGGEGLDSFLEQVGELKKNTALPLIEQFLKRNQVLYTAKEADDLNAINFGRASVNGVELIREEIDRLDKIRVERSSKPEDFDEHEIT
jgi:hypothetical protein